jgi:hypothetical protein
VKWFHREEHLPYPETEFDEVDMYDFVVDNAKPVSFEITDNDEL